jgi:hypothetical protein
VSYEGRRLDCATEPHKIGLFYPDINVMVNVVPINLRSIYRDLNMVAIDVRIRILYGFNRWS